MFLLHLSFFYKINIFTCMLDSERLPRYLIERRGKKTGIYWSDLDMEMSSAEKRWKTRCVEFMREEETIA